MESVYWTMKNGQKINVDDMDENHLRNTLKLILKRFKEAKYVVNRNGLKCHDEVYYDEFWKD